MGRILRIVVGILAIIALIYVIITGKLTLFVELLISANDKFIYTNDYKINDLQISKADFYFNMLTVNQKKIYSAIAKGVKELDDEVIVSKYELDTIDTASIDTKEAINAFLCDHPEVFYMNSQYTVSFTESILGKMLKIELLYSVKDMQELNSKILQLSAQIDSICSSVNGENNFDKELFVHDYLAKNVKYYSEFEDENSIEDKYHTAYAAIIEKQAVCDGITKACQLILDRMQIESYIVTGYIDKTPHAWNIVNLDGNCVHLDITSDKYVKDETGNTIEPVHTYFNVSTDFISNTHNMDKAENMPQAKNIDYNYYKNKGAFISINDDFDKRIKEIANSQKDRKVLEFSTDITMNVPERLLRQLYNINFNNYKSMGNNISMKYYNEQNVYIVQKD